MTDLDRRWDLPSAPEDLLYQAAILSRFFPALAVHLRSSLGGLYLAADSLAPEEARDFNARMDQDKSVLDLNYYRLLRLTGNLSLAADMDLPQDLPEEDMVCRETESLAKLLGLTLRFRCQEGRHLCALRRDAVRQLLLQLLSNAFKFTPAGGEITVALSSGNGWVQLTVTDNGPGIPPERKEHLFDRYLRADRNPIPPHGLGLGLPICQQLTQLMRGQLGVESTYGQGSTFWVRIPQKVVDPTPCGPYRDGEQRENNRNYNSFTAPEAVVLVVDDQPLNLKVCQGLLGPYEMEVYTARSGQEALRQMTQVWPDLVLMDHMMPGMDGVEATARIREMGRKDPYFAVVPIVALTANAMKGVREEFLQKGFNDFLPKPIELDKLDNVLRAWIPEDKQKAPAPALGDLVAEPIPEDLQRLPGIDVARGMSYCGTGQVYRKTLFLFREQIPGRLRRIRKAQETEEEQTARRKVAAFRRLYTG